MEIKTDFQRIFLIFTNEDSGYESAQKPSGHVKIEVREGRGKLWASVQNLLESGRLGYRLYLINAASGRVEAVPVGPLMLSSGKGRLEWEFNPFDVANTGRRIEDFGVAAVLVEYRDRENKTVICPLAAYKGKKIPWRSGLAERMYIKASRQDAPAAQDAGRRTDSSASKHARPEAWPVVSIPQPDSPGVASSISIAAPEVKYPEKKEYAESGEMPDGSGAAADHQDRDTGLQDKVSANSGGLDGIFEYGGLSGNGLLDDGIQVDEAQGFITREEEQEEPEEQENEALKGHNTYGREEENQYTVPESIWMPKPDQSLPRDAEGGEVQAPPAFQQNGQFMQYPENDGGLNTNCLYLNSNMCGAYVNAGAENPCARCTLHNRPETAGSREEKGNVERLRAELDANFERYDPFHVKRSDYSWWKVTNPVNLNNILYQCNIRSPLLFNPAVMVSHFKYKHLIIGIYTDRSREREYVVCGVFGMHMVDRKPFGDMCRWVQTEGTRPRYGAFGYWIVYLDPATGKILNLK